LKAFLRGLPGFKPIINLRSSLVQFEQSRPIFLAAQYVFSECIEGDYIEFGVFKGSSFIQALTAFEKASHTYSREWKKKNRSAYGIKQEQQADIDLKTHKRRDPEMRFFAFDSFEGLPSLAGEGEHPVWNQGRFKLPKEEFLENVYKHHFNKKDSIRVVKGYFSETLKSELYKKEKLEKVSVVMIDSDLYSSCKSALKFIEPLLQNGSIIIFDDWNAFKGSAEYGERKATKEWLEINKHIQLEPFASSGAYQRSFIVQKN